MLTRDAAASSSDVRLDLQAPLLTPQDGQFNKSCGTAVFERWWNSCTCVALTAATVVAGAALSFKLLSDDVSVFQIVVFRSLIALPILVPAGYYQTGCIFGPKDNMIRLILRGFCAAMDFTVGGISVSFLPLSEATLLGNCHPAVLAIMQWCLGIEGLDSWTWLGVIGTLIGQMLIARPPFLFGGDEEWDAKRIIGIIFAFVSSVFRSFGFLLVTKIDSKVPPIVTANYPQFIAPLVSIPFLLIGFPESFDSRPSLIHILLYFGAATDALNQILIVRSFQIGPAVKAAVLSMSRVLMTMSLGLIVCSEQFTFLHAIGAIVLLASITLVIVRKGRPQHSQDPAGEFLVSGKE